MLINEYKGEDDAPNFINLPIETYDKIDTDLPNKIEEKINYDNDLNVYIIDIKESNNYAVFYYSDIKIDIYLMSLVNLKF